MTQKVILVGGKYAGLKIQVPDGKRVLNIPNPKTVVSNVSHLDVHKAIQMPRMRDGMDMSLMDNPYILHPVTVASPTFDDAMSFVIGAPPGLSMSDAFMQILAGYEILCYPGDTENE